MREGYKLTKLGKIPTTWEIVTVNDITVSHKQGYYTKSAYSSSGVKLVRITDLKNPKVDFSQMPFLEISDKDYNDYKIEVGDFLFARSGAIGRYGIVEKLEHPAVFASYLINFKFNYSIISNRYFGYFYESGICSNQLKGIAQGNANININAENIKSLLISLPPISEQLKIAEILSTVDEKIELIDQQITQTQELKKGLMQQLLTKGIGHTKYKDSILGGIPESWSIAALGDVVLNLVSGVSVNSEDRRAFEGEYGILKTSAISKGMFNPNQHKTIIPSDIDRASINPKFDTILISRMNTPSLVGESGYVGGNYINLFLPDRIWMTEKVDKDKVLVKWLSYVIASPFMKEAITQVATGTSNSMKNISKPSFLGLKFLLPPKEEQIKICEVLTEIDAKIDVLISKKNAFEVLKKGLMQQLLTGKLRIF